MLCFIAFGCISTLNEEKEGKLIAIHHISTSVIKFISIYIINRLQNVLRLISITLQTSSPSDTLCSPRITLVPSSLRE